jgi:hypothetical protein
VLFWTACLVLVLAVCAVARVVEALLQTLAIDPVEAMFYLGLAEYD